MTPYDQFIDRNIAINLMADVFRATNSRQMCEIPQRVLFFLGIHGSQRFAADFFRNDIYEYDDERRQFSMKPCTQNFPGIVAIVVAAKLLAVNGSASFEGEVHRRATYNIPQRV